MKDNLIPGVKSNVAAQKLTIHADIMTIYIKLLDLTKGDLLKSQLHQVFAGLTVVFIHALAQ